MAEHKVRLGGERWAIPETLIRNDTNYFFGIFFLIPILILFVFLTK